MEQLCGRAEEDERIRKNQASGLENKLLPPADVSVPSGLKTVATTLPTLRTSRTIMQ